MDWLNYHHLYYFWTVAREGTIARACERLQLAQPTISAQIQSLEKALGEKLFNRTGRTLVMTEAGRVVYRYAEDIFSLGKELVDTVKGRPTGRPIRLSVGVADALPKLIAYRILLPALTLSPTVQLVCEEGKPEDLIAELAVHNLDIVLSDSPYRPDLKVRAYNHQLGECGVLIFGTNELIQRHPGPFPQMLRDAPFLFPTNNTSLRRSLDYWFESNQIRPDNRGEFEDSALIKVFGQASVGFFAASSVIEAEIVRQYNVQVVGRIDTVRERFYAISVERKLKHHAVIAICDAARRSLFV